MWNKVIEPFRYPKVNVTSIEATPSKGNKPKVRNRWGTIRRLWSQLSEQRAGLYFVFLLILVSSGLGLLGPLLVGRAIDEYIVTKQNDLIWTLLGGLALVYVLYSLSLWLQSFLMIGISQRTVFRIRENLFQQLHRLPIPYFDQRQHGETMSRMTNDIENVSSTLNSSVIQILSSILTLVGTVIVMLWLSPLLTFITFLVVPAMFYGMKWITSRTSRLFKGQQRHLGGLNGYIEETLSGQLLVKAFGQEKRTHQDFIDRSQELKGIAFWAQSYSGFIPKLMNMLNNLNFTLIAAVGSVMALYEWVTIGTIVIFAEYSRQFTRPLNDLANQYNTLSALKAGGTLKPLELMALANVDMSSPEPIRKAVAYVGSLVDELESSF